jgi:hypothetical protein
MKYDIPNDKLQMFDQYITGIDKDLDNISSPATADKGVSSVTPG